MAKNKRERKISKVMGEFKEGTLKSGGSGRQVTNPKQAIAIALSEANAMNQGGMMYNEIMNRPMFQTPQMREGGGIMAGVAPIRGYADGGEVDDEIVATGTEEELVDQLFGPGGLLFDTDAPVQSTLMALTIPVGAGLLGLTARGLMAARKAAKLKKLKEAGQLSQSRELIVRNPKQVAPLSPTLGQRVASSIKENPKKAAAAAGIAALGLGTPALIGEDEEGKPVVEDQPPPEQPPPPPPDPTFLDMLKGAGTQLKDFLQDPANQYALAKAAQPSEGIAPRNFASDFILGKEEYKQLEAQREDDTALMRNYEFLRETTDLSPKEIIDRLSGGETPREQFISLFGVGQATGRTSPEDIARYSALSGYELSDQDKLTFGITDKAQQPSAVVD